MLFTLQGLRQKKRSVSAYYGLKTPPYKLVSRNCFFLFWVKLKVTPVVVGVVVGRTRTIYEPKDG